MPPVNPYQGMGMKELRAKADELGVDLKGALDPQPQPCGWLPAPLCLHQGLCTRTFGSPVRLGCSRGLTLSWWRRVVAHRPRNSLRLAARVTRRPAACCACADCVEKEEMIARLEAQPLLYEAEPSESVGELTKPTMKGYLTKDAVQSKSNSKKRYFVLMGNFLMYYEDAKDSVFHPKGVWCLEDCRKGFMKRPGLNERQAVLLRGKRELVITAESIEDLKEWNRSIQEAAKFTLRNYHELQRSSEAELTKLRSHWDSMLVELEVTRSKLREEREARCAWPDSSARRPQAPRTWQARPSARSARTPRAPPHRVAGRRCSWRRTRCSRTTCS